jgi:uncharacterized protein (TIGR02246 family)
LEVNTMMTELRYGVVLALGMLSVAGVSWARDNPKVREAINAANTQFMGAAARGDGAAMASLYAEGGQAFPPGGDIVGGREALRNFWQSVLDSGVKKAALETVELTDAGDVAFEVGRYSLLGADGQALDTGKYVVVWKREEGKWLIHRDIWNSSRPPAAQ